MTGGSGSEFQDPSLRLGFQEFFQARSFHVPRQCHGATVETVSGPSSSHLYCDGLVGFRSGVHLSILTADCLPIFVRNRSSTRFALIHAGWRGLADRILGSTLNEFFEEPVYIVVGAHIGQEHYEVGDEVLDAMAKAVDQPREVLFDCGAVDENNRLSLFEIARIQAARARVEVMSVGTVNMDTADPETPLFSYRQTGTDCRMLHWIQKRT